jgi:hypothetical protein
MNRGLPSLLLAGAIAMAGTSVSYGQSSDLTFGVQTRGSASYLSFNHDASMYTPPGGFPMASYGNPTSILSYEPLYAADIEFVIGGRNEAGWVELIAGFPIAGGGTFGDRDYEAGQVLYSETFSDIAIGGGGDVTLRFSLPGDENWRLGGVAVQPYVVAGGGLRSYAAKGLRCGAACPSGAWPNTFTMIGQDIFTASAGFGTRVEAQVSERGMLDARVEVAGGYLGVSDSHYFRPDLGPVPNIAYDFATFGVSAEVGYTHAVTDNARVRAGLFADGQLGFGNVVFNSAGGGTGPAIPAWSHSLAGGVVLGTSISF